MMAVDVVNIPYGETDALFWSATGCGVIPSPATLFRWLMLLVLLIVFARDERTDDKSVFVFGLLFIVPP